jgi:Frequency clock protein
MNVKNDKDIGSYLRGIPDRPSPKHSTMMNEQSKKRMVAKRLEHLFTGRKAAPGGNATHYSSDKHQSPPLRETDINESYFTSTFGPRGHEKVTYFLLAPR